MPQPGADISPAGDTVGDSPPGDTLSTPDLKNGSGSVAQAPPPTAQPRAQRASGRAPISDLETVRHYFDSACERIGLPDDVQEVLRTSYRETSVQIPVRLSDGRLHVFQG